MKQLLLKQRFFSWLDSYDITDAEGNVAYSVKGELSWGHRLRVYDAERNPIAMLQQKPLSFLPTFHIYIGEEYVGMIRKEFTFLKPRFQLDMNGWTVNGNWLEWDYEVVDGDRTVAVVSKHLFQWTDTYGIEVERDEDALMALMIVLAIDAVKCDSK